MSCGARRKRSFLEDDKLFSWRTLFLTIDRCLKWWERNPLAKPIRRRALARAAEWMIERLEHCDGLGAIYPPMMYSVMALDVLGYAKDHPLRVERCASSTR